MKAIEIRDHAPEGKRRERKLFKRMASAVAFTLALATACGIGLYAGMGMTGDRVQADDVQVVTVETNQTVWDVARPIVDAEGLDIREVVYQIQVNNNLDKDCTVRPGQQLVIRF